MALMTRRFDAGTFGPTPIPQLILSKGLKILFHMYKFGVSKLLLPQWMGQPDFMM